MSIEDYFRKEVLDLPPYHLVTAQPGVKLDQNESPWDIPVELKAEIIETFLKIPWNRYPLEEDLLLKKKMAKYLGLWTDDLVFANGSNVLIQALVNATCIDKKVLVVDPTFSVYELEAKLFRNEIIRVPLNEDFSVPSELFLKTIKKEKPGIIFLASPNAPTGNIIDVGLLRKIIETANCLVVVDEAYYPFSGSTVIKWIKEYENLVVLRTFSKAFAFGGARLGYMAADPEICRQIEKVLLPFRINKLTYAAAMVVLQNPKYVDHYVKTICEERERVFKELSKIKKIKVINSQTNFLLFHVEKSEEVFRRLVHQRVIIRKISDGRRLIDYLRVSIGSPEENDLFITSLKKIIG